MEEGEEKRPRIYILYGRIGEEACL